MIIKKLQNNFTTPEQSKRLLELGLLADSADMLWDGSIDANEGWIFEDFPTYTDKPFSYYQLLYREEDVAHILPCWSVGRLVEIMLLCHISDDAGIMFDKPLYKVSNFTNIEWCIRVLESCIKYSHIDFSKLEDIL